MPQDIIIKPIGIVVSTRKIVADDNWAQENSEIQLDPEQFQSESLQGISSFSHIYVLFYMHLVKANAIHYTARHPRGDNNWPKVGIFAQRAKDRPNQLGLTVCELIKVDGLSIKVRGLDAINQTPVIDIKPYFKQFGPKGEVIQPDWVDSLMKSYY